MRGEERASVENVFENRVRWTCLYKDTAPNIGSRVGLLSHGVCPPGAGVSAEWMRSGGGLEVMSVRRGYESVSAMMSVRRGGAGVSAR
jgi:hypothetical protein